MQRWLPSRERLRRLVPTPEAVAGNRWLRWLGPSLLHPRLWHVSRRGIATGVAIGVFFAFITPIAQIPLSAAVAVALRANIPWAMVATLVNTPPTFGPVYYAAWKVGSVLLGEETDDSRAPVLPGGGAGASAAVGEAPRTTADTRTAVPAPTEPRAPGGGSAAAGVPAFAAPDAAPDATQDVGAVAGLWQRLQAIGKPLILGATLFAVGFSALAYVLVNAIWHLRVRRKRRRRLREAAVRRG